MPRYDESRPKSCTLREWKDLVLAEDAARTIIHRWPRNTPRQKILDELAAQGYVVRKTAAALPSGVTITKLPPGEANATPLRILRQEAEAAALRGESRIPLSKTAREQAEYDAENAAEILAETFAEARFGGMSVEDALDEANAASSRRKRRW